MLLKDYFKNWFVDELDYFYRKTHIKPTNCIIAPKIYDKFIYVNTEDKVIFLGIEIERGLGLEDYYFYIK